jgi:hypothetical protein
VRLKTNGSTSTFFEDESFGPVLTEQWYHVGFTYDGAALKIYRNGILTCDDYKSGTINTSTGIYTCLGANSDNTRFLDGVLDDVRIYDRCLSPQEITTMYTLKGKDGIKYGLLNHWRLRDHPNGTVATGNDSITDYTNRQHGTPINNPVYVEGIN